MLRFAPSPTGDMHIDTLRVAIFNYMVAKQKDVNFIVRIEDTDKERNIVGKDTEFMEILEKFALPHDNVSHQSENLHIHQTLAIRLLEEKKAFVCTCQETDASHKYSGRCTDMGAEELRKLKEEKTPFVIRIKKPSVVIVTHDIIKGDINAVPNDVDSFVILGADGTPTYNFACACADMISGISLIIRKEEHLANTSRQEYIKSLLGYEQETQYVHLPAITDTDETTTVKWLFEQGFIPDAIANYLIGLGNTTQTDIFTMPEALEWFDLTKISKSPTKFDLDRLRYINRRHLERIEDKKLSTLFGFADENIGKLAKVYLTVASTINELEACIKLIFKPKDFSGEWGEQMKIISDIIFNAPMIDTYEEFESYLMEKSGLKDENLFKPLRYLLTGAGDGPELSDIYPYIKSYILEIAS